MRNSVKYIFQLFILTLIYSCASVGSPEGGAKDETAPKVVESTPKNGTTNFTGNTLRLEFDEEVQLKDLTRQLIISPTFNSTYKSTISKTRLTLTFDKPFAPNTTYFINFRGGVEDITEGNKPKDLTLTFSTGTYIDSGRVSGTVRDLYTNALEKNINVVLYTNLPNDTTTIREDKPYYFTQTDEKGNFTFQNIRFGDYRIYAHSDLNNNTIYENEKEKIGYRKDPLKINDTTASVNLTTLKVDTKKPLIESSVKYLEEYRITFNEGITSLKINPLTSPTTAAQTIYLIDTKGTTASIYPTTTLPKADYIITAIDSSNNTLIDTVNIAFEGKKAPRPSEPFSIKNYSSSIATDEPLEINFVVPVKITGSNPLIIIEDSVNRRPLNTPQDFKFNETFTKVTLAQISKAKKSIQVEIDTTKLLPISGTPFRKTIVKMPVTEKLQVGEMSGKITTTYKRYWIELLNQAGDIILTQDSPKSLKINKLPPATYRIRVKIDEDNNGIWRIGNKDLTTPPEKIYHYPNTVEIRVNWEREGIDLTF